MEDHIVGGLSRAEALERTQQGGTIVCLSMPSNVDFGIDLRSYSVGPQFRGIKMIPCDDHSAGAMHFVTCGSELATCGVFVALRPADVCVFRWDASDELLKPLADDDDEAAQLTAAVRHMELDASLGPYPLATEAQWRELSGHITPRVLKRAGIPVGTLVAAGLDGAEMKQLEREVEAARAKQKQLNPTSQQPSLQRSRAASESAAACLSRVASPSASFVQLDPRSGGRGRSGAALSRFHLDKSEWLTQLLREAYADSSSAAANGAAAAAEGSNARGSAASGGDAAAEGHLLGELQLAYLLFLRLSSLRALEQWKALVHLLLSCEEALHARPRLYVQALATLRAQLSLAPHDFFDAEVGEDNFLLDALASLAEHTESTAGSDGMPRAVVAPALAEELGRLWAFIGSRFGISVEALRASAIEEDEEDAPVVVEGL